MLDFPKPDNVKAVLFKMRKFDSLINVRSYCNILHDKSPPIFCQAVRHMELKFSDATQLRFQCQITAWQSKAKKSMSRVRNKGGKTPSHFLTVKISIDFLKSIYFTGERHLVG
uniref:Uncharacterized protein n=1 Tax=Romanomermis culicivorax TaxID=13658 RepID=A0A915K853_ROMCU